MYKIQKETEKGERKVNAKVKNKKPKVERKYGI
jgi:hypothetical protein